MRIRMLAVVGAFLLTAGVGAGLVTAGPAAASTGVTNRRFGRHPTSRS
jgi:hypothetical protein